MDRERVLDFIRSFSVDRGSDSLKAIEAEAVRDRVPVIRRETRELLKILLQMKKPEKILEVGAAIGFSSVFMGENTSPATKITTIENYPPRIERAKANIAMAGMEEQITLLEGDAARWLKELDGSYDFIFMDAAKGQYIHFLPDVLRLLPQGGVLVSDNVLQDGDIFESRYGIRRRNHTIHSRMREYLFALTHNDTLDTVILETGDGMTISVKK
ncbi:MAG TPA: O-methyltransferase [Candidatus Anaerobutyricum stercoris]|uniref:tRNA 5-hydroxyuridine methyltransferase n=1 Tax=Candidatus Anaerobutyricum stercoris TaxID=2838457 RepID=A0A9D2EMW1_9FIRM|nr:Putative O-methyltransferase/MSMEI_4947 [Eubacteriaceae bacterium CHKCI004]HIZ40589.1 O-methyltransferase [Candidatus Anaerobutyricum stercoris]